MVAAVITISLRHADRIFFWLESSLSLCSAFGRARFSVTHELT